MTCGMGFFLLAERKIMINPEKPSRKAIGERERYGESLIFQQSAMSRRLHALLRAMSTDFLLREQFVTDPAQISAEYVYGTRIPVQQSSAVNRIIFAVMSNPDLVAWLRSYSKRNRNPLPSSNKFLSDFSRALTKSDGHHVVIALLRGFVDRDSTFVIDDVLLRVLLSVFAAEPSGIVSSEGTEMS